MRKTLFFVANLRGRKKQCVSYGIKENVLNQHAAGAHLESAFNSTSTPNCQFTPTRLELSVSVYIDSRDTASLIALTILVRNPQTPPVIKYNHRGVPRNLSRTFYGNYLLSRVAPFRVSDSVS
jgi:hypothetical protein